MKLQKILCIAVIVLFGLITLSYADSNQMIICNDGNLYNALCSYFGDSKIIKKDNEKLIIEVAQETISSVTELDLSNKNISDLKGLEVFSNLVSLRVSNNQISNLSPIRDLYGIQYLYLNNNNISDISLLVPTGTPPTAEDGAGAENMLNILDLSGNKIADISSVSTFSNLVTLNLIGNQISSVEAISGLEKLNNLYLNNNKITDIAPISSMKELKTLNLQNNKITKIESLDFENIESLNLKNNKLVNVDFLSNLNTLKSLDLSYNQIVKIPEFFANWINNKKIADIKINNQTLNLVTQDNEINFGKNSSYTNLLYFGFFYNSDLKIGLENGKLNTEKLIFSLEDANKTGKITINDGVFKNSTIKIDYGGSSDVETAPSEDENKDNNVTDTNPDGNTNAENKTENNIENNTENKVENNTENNPENNPEGNPENNPDSNLENNPENNLENNPEGNPENNTTDINTENQVDNSNVQNTTDNVESGDSTTASGKMPYTGVASKIMIVITFISVILVGTYTFSKNKK